MKKEETEKPLETFIEIGGRNSSQIGKNMLGSDILVSQGSFETRDDYIEELKKIYDSRLKSLYEQIGKIYEQISSDKKSHEHSGGVEEAEQRQLILRQIITENLNSEKEYQIKKISEDLASTRVESQKLRQTVQQLTAKNKEQSTLLAYYERVKNAPPTKTEFRSGSIKSDERGLEDSFKRQEEHYKGIIIKYIEQFTTSKNENIKLLEKIEQLEAQCNALNRTKYPSELKITSPNKLTVERIPIPTPRESEIDQGLVKELQSENYMLKDANARYLAELSKLEDRLRETATRAKFLEEEKLNLSGRLFSAEKTLSNTQFSPLKSEPQRLKTKISELRSSISQYEGDYQKSKRIIAEMKISQEKLSADLQEEIARTRDEYEHRLYEQDLDHQRRYSELKSSHAMEIAQLQEEWQQQLEAKIQEVQAITHTEVEAAGEKYRELKSLYDAKLLEIDNCYISLEKHQKILAEEEVKNKAIREKDIEKYKADLSIKEKSSNNEINKLVEFHKQKSEVDLNSHKKTVQVLEEKYDILNNSKMAVEKSRQAVSKELKKANEQLAEIQKDLENAKNKIEEEKSARKEAEVQAVTTKQSYAELLEQHNKSNQLCIALSSEKEKLKATIITLQNEINKHFETIKNLQIEQEVLNMNLSREKIERSKEIARNNEALEHKIQEAEEIRLQLGETREKDRQIIEEEVANHMETKNKLLSEQQKTENMLSEIENLKHKYEEQIINGEMLQKEIEHKSNQNSELISVLEISKNEFLSLESGYTALSLHKAKLQKRLWYIININLIIF